MELRESLNQILPFFFLHLFSPIKRIDEGNMTPDYLNKYFPTIKTPNNINI